MGDIEQLQYGCLTDNQDEMTSLGDIKTHAFCCIKYLLDIFKYLINEYKNDKNKLNKIVESFNETFETDFITKYDLIKEFGDSTCLYNQPKKNILSKCPFPYCSGILILSLPTR